MLKRSDILREHYLGLLRGLVSKAGVVVLTLAMLAVPATSQAAGQLTARSVTLSTSANNTVGGTGVSYAFKFTFGTSGQTVASFKMEICDSPLATASCVNSGTSSGATFTPATSVSTAVNTGTWTNGTTCSTLGTHTGNSALINCTSGVITATPTVTVTVNGVTNPTANGQFYVRISSYTTANAGAPAYPGTDYGAVAVDTVNVISASANVQESLSFCTGTSGANCAGISGTSVSVGTTADNVLTNGTPSGGVAIMYIDTNAASGYSITYTSATNFVSGANTIQSANNQTMATCASGAPNGDCFGINLAANTATGLGSSAAPTGGTAPTVNSGYGTANTYKFVSGSAQQVSSLASPTQTTTYKVSYAAQAGPTTKPGGYSTTFTWIATGTF